MARMPSAPLRAENPLQNTLRPEQQYERLQYSTSPNVKGIDAAVQRIHALFGVQVTEHYLRRAITKRRLQRHEIGHVIHFSDRDLYEFIVLNTKKPNA
ncbi:hypothetical protein [Mycobacterium paraffinicum]|uniref:hypothetical protein n=1 Tax=Mycobacterium paraffinicum TaxID=53378 RepID=UPI0011147B57|nr:hypothetical protein [Mycobacterium paraffinicum]